MFDVRKSLPASFRLSVFFAALFFGVGVYMPFFPVWLASRGLNPSEIGIVLALPMVMRIVTTSLTGAFADRMTELRHAVMIFAAVSVSLFALLFFAHDFYTIAVLMAVTAIFWMPLTPLSDALALIVSRRDGSDYGRMRLWGSIAFIAANLGAGWFVGHYSGAVVYPFLLGAFTAVFLSSIILPRVAAAPTDPEVEAGAGRKILRQPLFLAVLLAGGMTQASHAMVYGFGTLYWRSAELSGSEIGALWGVGVVAEILLFTMSGRVVALASPLGMIAIGATAAVIRWAVFPSVDGFGPFLLVQLLHGLTFGATHLGLVHHVAQAVPERFAGAGQGLAVTIITAAMAASTALSGPVYRTFGVDGFYAMSLLAFAALALVALIAVLRRNG